MSEQLTTFLTRLATDDDLVNEFEQDKAGTMRAHGISEDHIDMVLNKQYTEIQGLLGADYTIAKNSIVKAFKN